MEEVRMASKGCEFHQQLHSTHCLFVYFADIVEIVANLGLSWCGIINLPIELRNDSQLTLGSEYRRYPSSYYRGTLTAP